MERLRTLRRPTVFIVSALFVCAMALCGLLATSAHAAPNQIPTQTSAPDPVQEPTQDPPQTGGGTETWTICWYLCGTDLETDMGAATTDLQEMLNVELPDNVTVVIETGGAKEWQNDVISSDNLERYCYSSEGFYRIETLGDESMGKASTLSDFMTFCTQEYPADHMVLVIWDHGGGSGGGAAYDEKYNYDYLTTGDMEMALEASFDVNPQTKPFEIVGFDACLMATTDMVDVFDGYANYLVASEEVEPGTGWNYTGFLGAFAENPEIEPVDLCIAICDTFIQTGKNADRQTTLSVIDLEKAQDLLVAYKNMGDEGLHQAVESATFLPAFSRGAYRALNFGGNTDDEGYANMVDLESLVLEVEEIFPESAQAVLDAIDGCVIYKVNGAYCSDACGISCYYPLSGKARDLKDYAICESNEPFVYLYDYAIDGELDDDGAAYLAELEQSVDATPQDVWSIEEHLGTADLDVQVDDTGRATLTVGPEVAPHISGVYAHLGFYSYDADILVGLGRTNDVTADWEQGVFSDNFRDTWGSLDGHLAYMELIEKSEDYNVYSVPMLINDEEYCLRVGYHPSSGEYEIIGACQGLYDNGMAARDLRQLQKGDRVTLMLYAATISGDDSMQLTTSDSLVVTDTTSFYETSLGDGNFIYSFEITDASGASAYSEPVLFDVEGGQITTSTRN